MVALYIGSKFGDLAIFQSDIQHAQNPNTLGAKLSRIWDHITDWFLRTNYVEAKQHLTVLYDAGATPRDKAESFFKLKSLAAPAYQDRFVAADEPYGYSLQIKYGGGLKPYTLSVQICDPSVLAKTLNEHTSKALTSAATRAKYEKALTDDLPRSRYSLRSQKLHFTDAEPPLGTFREAIFNVPGNEKQVNAAAAIASQKLFAFLIGSSAEVVDPRQFMHFGAGGGQTSFNFFSDKKGGVIMHARSEARWQSEVKSADAMKQLEATAGPRSPMLLAPVYDARILIDSEGRATVQSAVVGIDPARK